MARRAGRLMRRFRTTSMRSAMSVCPTHDWPAITRVIASNSSSVAQSFSTTPRAPSWTAISSCDLSSPPDRMMVRVVSHEVADHAEGVEARQARHGHVEQQQIGRARNATVSMVSSPAARLADHLEAVADVDAAHVAGPPTAARASSCRRLALNMHSSSAMTTRAARPARPGRCEDQSIEKWCSFSPGSPHPSKQYAGALRGPSRRRAPAHSHATARRARRSKRTISRRQQAGRA